MMASVDSRALSLRARHTDDGSPLEGAGIDTAPRDGRDLLLFGRPHGRAVFFVAGWWTAKQDWADDSGRVCPFEPTHWMDLPSPPKDLTK